MQAKLPGCLARFLVGASLLAKNLRTSR
ncbi:UNVERIFIED_ORG: hypothetical protein OKW16_003951 [Pseudomonas reinekei]|nr:hypothetical protein [Pseudomonas reinekei]